MKLFMTTITSQVYVSVVFLEIEMILDKKADGNLNIHNCALNLNRVVNGSLHYSV